MSSDTPLTDALVREVEEAETSWPLSAIHFLALACRMEKRVTRLEAQLAEMRKDSERLDWLNEQGKPETYEDAPHAMVWVLVGELGQTELRAAIDAAMKP
jgi:hypothetical protein